MSVCQGEDIPRKGGPAITRSELLIINRRDLAPRVEANLDNMRADAAIARADKPVIFSDMKQGLGVQQIVEYLVKRGGLDSHT